MKICVTCNSEFLNYGREVGCSIKCKILADAIKTESGCWLYKKSASGAYGKIRFKMKWYSAHRESYKAFKGEIPDGKWVCHSCDIPKCVNPDHLFLGTAKENMKDASKKNRLITGQNCPLAKFTDIQTEEMKKLREEGFTYERLMRIFNCSMVHLSNIFASKKYRRK